MNRADRPNLLRTHPDLAQEWGSGNERTPADVHEGSHDEVRWRCAKCAHEWLASVRQRAKGRKKCERCESLAALHPELIGEFDLEKSAPHTPWSVSAKSTIRVWWRCSTCGHPWPAPVRNRTKENGSGCNECAKRARARALATPPEEAIERYRKVGAELREPFVNVHEPHLVLFMCCRDEDRVGLADLEKRVKERGRAGWCPGCNEKERGRAKRLPLEVARQRFHACQLEFIDEEFKGLSVPHRVRFLFCGHEGTARLADAENGYAPCWKCRSLAVVFPEVAKEWHPTKNDGLSPEQISYGSNRPCFWLFPCGHERDVPVKARTLGEAGCPVCAGKDTAPDRNLAVTSRLLAREWHTEKNGGLRPEDETYGSGIDRWWRCLDNPAHEWEASPNSRTSSRSGCPVCALLLVPRSAVEVRLAFELRLFFTFDPGNHAVEGTKPGKKHDVDIVLPDERILIEYDGGYWHREKGESDERKTLDLGRAGWRVIRVREHPLPRLSHRDVVLPDGTSTKECANAVLLHLQEVTGRTLPGLADYLAQTDLQNGAAAEEALSELRKRRVSRAMARAQRSGCQDESQLSFNGL